ncbi:hypothetical protein CMO88_00555 [Candidatus Woesearchaeota archaeon]|nr:hypothetical protein [Candidatus Woesearchaeota archaeon]|tara:strand:- start:19760 stop:20146 length:387 start_codon:yes stop_codon:yes gene_type:complete
MLTLQFIPYSDIESLTLDQKIKKLLGVVKNEKIVVMEGRLKKTEEAELIKATMENISNKFKGIEISVVYPENKTETLGKKLKSGLAELLLGERQGLTVIGPATLIKEIKKNPDKIQLLTAEKKRKRKK